jgi:UDP-GlcNAc:undecaprenyl-phosphate/decaprenyl-phosphate GlcNAc-1-phosphate transferase
LGSRRDPVNLTLYKMAVIEEKFPMIDFTGAIMAGSFLFGAMLVALLLGFPIYSVLRSREIVAYPNERSSHTSPTVCGGGIALILALLMALGFLYWHFDEGIYLVSLFVLTAALAIVSWIDDLKEISSLVRLGFHSLAAIAWVLLMEASSLSFEITSEVSLEFPRLVATVIAFLWMAGYTNAFNFMDGINGISGMQAGLTGILMGLMSGMVSGEWAHPAVLLAFAVGGASLGFLPHNFPKARMFMGDVGSAPLGFLLAAVALWMSSAFGWWLLIPLALLHANYVLDTGVTLTRRVLRGESWHSAHREHFYQRLVRSGRTHSFVTLTQGALQLIIGLLVLGIYINSGGGVRLVIIALVLLLWGCYFYFSEMSFRRCTENKRVLS